MPLMPPSNDQKLKFYAELNGLTLEDFVYTDEELVARNEPGYRARAQMLLETKNSEPRRLKLNQVAAWVLVRERVTGAQIAENTEITYEATQLCLRALHHGVSGRRAFDVNVKNEHTPWLIDCEGEEVPMNTGVSYTRKWYMPTPALTWAASNTELFPDLSREIFNLAAQDLGSESGL